MWLDFLKPRAQPKSHSAPATLQLGERSIPLFVIRNPRARRYLLRLRPDGAARVTIPRGGSEAQALAFVEKNRDWLLNQLHRQQTQPQKPTAWTIGSEIWFRGERVKIELAEAGKISVGTQHIKIAASHSFSPTGGEGRDEGANLRPTIEKFLHRLATKELPPQVFALAQQHGLTVNRVSVRNQKSRWGSCSRRGTISLNWRLIQTPEFVRDYIILHELAHLRHMNHSERFWAEVERLCPDYREAERWLKTNRGFLR